MTDYTIFFLALGVYNLAGVALLMLFYSDKKGDTIIRKYCQILANPYQLSGAGLLWLNFAIVLNLFFAIINLLAYRWDVVAQSDLLLVDLMLYATFLLLSIRALFSNKFGKGIWFNFPLFGFWLIWGAYLFFK